MNRWLPSVSRTDVFVTPFAAAAIGREGNEDPVLMARAAVAVLAGESQSDYDVYYGPAFRAVVELIGTFVAGGFLVPFMNAFGQAAGQDIYAALKKRLSLLRATSSRGEHEEVTGETRITEPSIGTHLIVVKGGTVDDVARQLAKFTPEQIAAKTLVWREDAHRFEIASTRPLGAQGPPKLS
jgi:hypothetical protein